MNSKYEKGAIVKVQLYGGSGPKRDKSGEPFYGVVVGNVVTEGTYSSDKHVVYVRTFERGFAYDAPIIADDHDISPAAVVDVVDSYRACVNQLQPIITEGAIQGALATRKEFNLEAVIRRLDSGTNHFRAVGDTIETPKTGVYVVTPFYSGKEPDLRNILAVGVTPRIDEATLAEVLALIPPAGLPRKGDTSLHLERTTGGELVSYHAVEIPAKGVPMWSQFTLFNGAGRLENNTISIPLLHHNNLYIPPALLKTSIRGRMSKRVEGA